MTAAVVTEAVEQRLEQFFAERIDRARQIGPLYAELWEGLRRSNEGGKRVRPHLVLAAHRAYGGEEDSAAITLAAAFELLHHALLLHDDVIDGDLIRRGRPNLAGTQQAAAEAAGLPPARAQLWGESSAILAGDLMLSSAHTLVAGVPAQARAEVLEIFDETVYLAAAGEQADVALSVGMLDADPEGLMSVMANKTASYSFAAPLRAGAALAGAGQQITQDLEAIGHQMGILFQLRDDMLGVFGQEQLTGKSALGDLREGKRTVLISRAEQLPAWQLVRHLFGKPDLTDAEAERLRSALMDTGAYEAVESMIAEGRAELLVRIGESGAPRSLQEELARLTWRCTDRDA
ncbi:polyprenyl synthetase family protein [Bogoriella caseilytica]|uniref:Geranylgeranyl diphosphate synthase type II n=1 Tax=Bogoriella caseilytica TaxID=56055 RepID=A0A3N2BCS4_9MICO|nr:polyprenyl synthetase family protein [Bogoriella caseilytica]ROR73022.1 geranylgeranyl diphosphate synthase type II [Bogoriella caseilytica]